MADLADTSELLAFAGELTAAPAQIETGVPKGLDPTAEGLARAAETYKNGLAVIGLTGGEPLLSFDASIAFLNRARELFPEAHKRMYTSGDLLTEDMARALRDAGLQEIRFSVKDFDPEPMQERVLDAMRLAKRYIPDVMVEMPIIPGTEARMKELAPEAEQSESAKKAMGQIKAGIDRAKKIRDSLAMMFRALGGVDDTASVELNDNESALLSYVDIR